MQHKLFVYAFLTLSALSVLAVQSFVTGTSVSERISVLFPTELTEDALSAFALGSQEKTYSDYAGEGLRITDTRLGMGDTAERGDIVRVLFTMRTQDGILLASAQDARKPYEFRIGSDNVIEGMHIGVTGMTVGSTRRIVVPPEYGYENTPPTGLSADESLIVEVTLLGIQ